MENIKETLEFIYDKVVHIKDKDLYLVKSKDKEEYQLIDRTGKVRKSEVPLRDAVYTSSILFGKEKFDTNRFYISTNWKIYNSVNFKEIETFKNFEFSEVIPLKCGATIVALAEDTRYAILDSNGKILAPLIYDNIKVLESNETEAKLLLVYTDRNREVDKNTTFSQTKILDNGTRLLHLGIFDFSTTYEDYQFEIVDFDRQKDLHFLKPKYDFWGRNITNDIESYKMKVAPVYNGARIGKFTYDAIINKREFRENGYFLVANKVIGIEAKKYDTYYYTGVVDIRGRELVKPKYKEIEYMGNAIFKCITLDKQIEIVVNGELQQHLVGKIRAAATLRVPAIVVVDNQNKQKYLGNDMEMHDNIMESFEIEKLNYNGGATIDGIEINRVNIYGTKYILDNNFNILDTNIINKLNELENQKLISWYRIN